MKAVVGISDHIGWAELVTVTLRRGTPVLLDRWRVALVDEGLASAPYHHESLELELAAARVPVERVRRSVDARARAALSSLRRDHPVGAVVLRRSALTSAPPAPALQA